MTNHPNRNWRLRMREHADAYVEHQSGGWPADGVGVLLSRAELEQHIRQAFAGGYACGREVARKS